MININVSFHTWLHIHINIYFYMYICISICIYNHIRIYVHMYMSIYIHMSKYVSIYVYPQAAASRHRNENNPAKEKGVARLTRTRHGINCDTADTDTTDMACRAIR